MLYIKEKETVAFHSQAAQSSMAYVEGLIVQHPIERQDFPQNLVLNAVRIIFNY